jgi:hypothetical protein
MIASLSKFLVPVFFVVAHLVCQSISHVLIVKELPNEVLTLSIRIPRFVLISLKLLLDLFIELHFFKANGCVFSFF